MVSKINKSIMAKHKQNKRTRNDLSSDSEDDRESFPRFLIIQATDPTKPLKLSPFAINKGIEGLAGPVRNVSRLRSGDILVEVDRAVQSKNLLKVKLFVNIPVKVFPHRSLNSSKGVIRCSELRDCETEEILDELSDQGVTEVFRVSSFNNGERKRTNTLFLTFNAPSIPSYVKVGYLRVKVDPYIPNPIRCFKCHKFGHFQSVCTKQECCSKCGQEGHVASDCKNLVKCINCGGNHSSDSRNCPKWLEEKKIQEIKTLQHVSYPEARKRFQSQQPQNSSYADKASASPVAAKQKVRGKTLSDACCQTTLTWMKGDFPSSTSKHISTSTGEIKTQKKPEENKKDPRKVETPRRSRSLTRDPVGTKKASGSLTDKIKQIKKPVEKVKSNLSEYTSQNKYSSLTIEGVEEMDVIPPSNPPPSKLQIVKKKDKT